MDCEDVEVGVIYKVQRSGVKTHAKWVATRKYQNKNGIWEVECINAKDYGMKGASIRTFLPEELISLEKPKKSRKGAGKVDNKIVATIGDEISKTGVALPAGVTLHWADVEFWPAQGRRGRKSKDEV